MKWNRRWSMYSMFFLIYSCKPPFPEWEELSKNVIIEDRVFLPAMDSLFIAHGGLGKWKELGTMQFHVSSDFHPFGNEVHIVDIVDRYVYIKNEQFTLGYDGSEYWISPGLTFAKEFDVLAYKDMMYYLLSFPFVMADPSIQCSESKLIENERNKYLCIECHFSNDHVEKFHDRYTLYLDSEKYSLEWIEYTSNAQIEGINGHKVILKFNTWITHRGLKLPGEIGAHDENENRLFSIRFSDIVLQEERPDTSLFSSSEVRDVIQ